MIYAAKKNDDTIFIERKNSLLWQNMSWEEEQEPDWIAGWHKDNTHLQTLIQNTGTCI